MELYSFQLHQSHLDIFYINLINNKITLIKKLLNFIVFHFFLFFNRPFYNGFNDKPSPSILSIVSEFFSLILPI